MEYELASSNGKHHGTFDTYEEAAAALCEEEAASPGVTDGWLLIAFDDIGNPLGEPQLAEDVMAAESASETVIQFVMHGEGGLFKPQLRAASSETAASIRRGFRRPPSDAIGTRVLPAAEKVAGR
jgi:23S rRNA pseudoU1915 N3-methylase RlmH